MSTFTFKPTFGAVATTNAGTGGLFGSTATPAAATPAFGFGASAASTAPAFGTPAAASTGFGGFGTSTATTSATGFTGFGATATAFGAQPAVNTTPAFGGFGTTPATSVASGFGSGTTGFGTSSGFGTTTGTGFGTTGGAFGTTGTGFGGATSGFGLKPGQTSFGSTGMATGGLFGTQAAQQQQQQQQANALSNIIAAVTPVIFGDERDTVLTKWNQLEAFWGAGKGFFNQQGQSVDFTPDNPFSFFKAVGYNVLPSNRNEDGLVALTIDRKMSEVCDNQQAIVDMLQRIVTNNQANTTLCVEGIRPLVDDKTEMVIYVQQRANTGVTTRVVASDLFNHLNTVRPNLTTQLAVSAALPKTGMTPEQKKLYLDNPPAGIDGRIWEQAKLDNPDPERMIPVPMVGFTELHNRLKHQEQQTSLHQARLDLIANDIASLQRNQADVVAKTEEYKRNQLVLGHRVLKVLVKQELYRKHGYAIQADEEQLRTKLETIYAELSAPMQFKGRLSELMSQLRMQSQLGVAARYDTSYQIEPSVQQELKQHLKRQQEGLSVLLQVLKDDLNELKIIEQGLADAAKPRR